MVEARAVVCLEREATGVARSNLVKIIGAGTALLLLAVILSLSYFASSDKGRQYSRLRDPQDNTKRRSQYRRLHV